MTFTPVPGVGALAGSFLYACSWLDPAMYVVGAIRVPLCTRNRLIDTGKVLRDCEMDAAAIEQNRDAVEEAHA